MKSKIKISSNKAKFREKALNETDRPFITIKHEMQNEDLTLRNVHIPNNIAFKLIKQKL